MPTQHADPLIVVPDARSRTPSEAFVRVTPAATVKAPPSSTVNVPWLVSRDGCVPLGSVPTNWRRPLFTVVPETWTCAACATVTRPPSVPADQSNVPLPRRLNVPPRTSPLAAPIVPSCRWNFGARFCAPCIAAWAPFSIVQVPAPLYVAPSDAVAIPPSVSRPAPAATVSVPFWFTSTPFACSVPESTRIVPLLTIVAGALQHDSALNSLVPDDVSVPPGSTVRCSAP